MVVSDGFCSAWGDLSRISLPPLLSPRCLSLTFSEPSRPITSARRKMAWVTLEGRLVGAAEATSSKTVGKGLSVTEAAAWELFPPLHRVLLVAIVAIASADNTRSRRISKIQRSVDTRDEVLRNMQVKLDDLCEQMRLIKHQSPTSDCNFSWHNEHLINREISKAAGEGKLCHCCTQALHLDADSGIVPLCSNPTIKTMDLHITEFGKERLFENNHEISSEQEERRMSDLSDFCWSVASSSDIQPVHLSTLAAEQELYNLRNECEEKDAAIKDLRTAADASTVAYSKRIAELEEIIRRKNMTTTKLKKDIAALEQQVKKHASLRRQSSSSSSSSSTTPITPRPPVMAENILYDMSSTSPSSSDCSSPERNRTHPPCTSTNQILRQNSQHRRLQASSFSNERRSTVHRKVEATPTAASQRQVTSSSMLDNKKARRRNLQDEKNLISSSQKKWV